MKSPLPLKVLALATFIWCLMFSGSIPLVDPPTTGAAVEIAPCNAKINAVDDEITLVKGESMVLIGNLPNGGGNSYAWHREDNNGWTNMNENTRFLKIKPGNTKQYRYTVRNGDDVCRDWVTVNVTENDSCNLDVSIQESDATLCDGEVELTASTTGAAFCKEVSTVYKLTNATTPGGNDACFPKEDTTGFIFQRDCEVVNGGIKVTSPFTVWRATDNVTLTRYTDGSGHITGRIRTVDKFNGEWKKADIDIWLYKNIAEGNTWNGPEGCYADNLGNNKSFFQEISGTINVIGDKKYTVDSKESARDFIPHFVMANNAAFGGHRQLGIGGWASGSFGGCSEWFANLEEINDASINTDFSLEWTNENGDVVGTGETITVTEPGSYTVTAVDCKDCKASEVIEVKGSNAVANAGLDVTVQSGNSTELIATGGDSYLWNTGETTEVIIVDPTETTEYSVTVIKDGCEDQDSVIVTVVPACNFSIDDLVDVNISSGESTTLTAPGGTNGYSYSWSNGATTRSITVSPESTKTYYVTVIDGNCEDITDVTVIVDDCVIEVNVPDEVLICDADGVEISVSVENEPVCEEKTIEKIWKITDTDTDTEEYCFFYEGVGIFYAKGCTVQLTKGIWSAGDSNSSNVRFIEYSDGTAEITGTLTRDYDGKVAELSVFLYEKSTSGKSWERLCYQDRLQGEETYYERFSGTLTIPGEKPLTIGNNAAGHHFILANGAGFGGPNQYGFGGWTSGTSGACGEWFGNLEDVTNEENTSDEGVTYEWSTGETTSTITVTETGEYSVTVKGCDDCEVTKTITVKDSDAIADAGADIEVALGIETTLETPEIEGASYVWKVGNTVIGTERVVKVSPVETTTYTVEVTTVEGCTAEDSITITVGSDCAEFTVPVINNVTISSGETATLTANGGSEYLWSNGDTTQSITVSPSLTTTYFVTVTSPDGLCQDIVGAKVIVENDCEFDITGIPETEEICDGDEIVLTPEVSFETNPTDDNIYKVYQIVDSRMDTCWSTTVDGGRNGVLFVNDSDFTPYQSWKAGADLRLYQYDNGNRAEIRGTVVRNNEVAQVEIYFSNREELDKWSSGGCYGSTLSGPRLFYNGIYGTITYSDNRTESISARGTNGGKHALIGTGAGFKEGEFGIGIWSGGSLGEKSEWFGGLEEITDYQPENCEVTYAWTKTDGDNPSNTVISTDETFTVTTPGEYTVSVTSCDDCVAEKTVVVESKTTDLDIVNNGTCDLVLYEYSDTTGQWVEVTDLVAGQSWNYDVTKGQSLELRGTDLAGNVETFSYDVESCDAANLTWTVTPDFCECPNDGDFADIDGNSTITIGQSTTLMATGGDANSQYEWSTGETTQEITVSPVTNTDYTVTITNVNGCEDLAAVNVMVGAIIDPCEGITADAGNDQFVCNTIPAQVTLSANEYSNQATYSWVDANDNVVGNTRVITIDSPTNNTNYTVTVTEGECSASDTVRVTTSEITATIDASISLNADGNGEILAGDSVTLTANGGGNQASYLWSTSETTRTITVSPEVTTTYTVLIARSNGCSDEDEITIVVNEPKASLGDTVFNDEDGDGVQDPGEEGVPGVTVNLYECDETTIVATTTTDANGNYNFGDLEAGNYQVEFVLPDGYEYSPADQGGDDANDSDVNEDGKTDCIELEAGENNDTVDAGISTPKGSIGDTVFNDEDGDGVQDPGEEGVPEVTVNLYECDETTIVATTTTDANGNYNFGDLEAGNYQVEFVLPDGSVFSPAGQGSEATDSDANADGKTDCIELAPGEDNNDVDAGIIDPVNIGDYVWNDTDRDGIQDSGEQGVPGVTVQLVDSNGDVVDTAVTDENGLYTFEDVLPGDYTIVFDPTTLPEDFVFSPADQGGDDSNDSDAGADGSTPVFTVTSGQEDDLTFDAGINVPGASLGDTVFNDEDGDGVQDPGEEGVPGVTVNLYECDETTIVATTTTDANGNYNFGDLEAGNYQVEFVLPDGYEYSPADQGGDDANDSDVNADGKTDCIELEAGENNDTVDAGISTPKGSIGDTVFNDEDGDGVQDPGEEGVPGVTVNLYECDETTIVATTTTDANGNYNFGDLEAGNYQVEFVLPDGYEYSPADQGGDDANDSDANEDGRTDCIELAPGENNDTVDAGISTPKGSIGDTVFNDEDGDGVQDPGEEGVPGVTVNLYECDETTIVATTTTDANGNYNFGDLEAGNYQVEFVLPDGYEYSPADQGGDDANDSDVNADGKTDCIELEAGENNDTVDAGISTPKGSIGDTVFNDEDGDGVQDPGEEGVPEVTVNLYECDETTIVATTTTDANGNYNFGDLEAGNYQVEFVLPDGSVFSPAGQGSEATDSDANADGKTDCIELAPGEDNNDVDAGIIDPVNIGDYVWNDTDRDGIQDSGEQGVPGVTVQLVDSNGDVVDTAVTDENGLYTFEDVLPGDYTIVFDPTTLPEDFVFSPADQGGDDSNDSDAGADGSTPVFTVTSGQEDDLTFDAGINVPGASLGDTVFNDEDGDGVQDPGEEGVPGVTVNLYECDETTIVATTTTDANGNYNFGDLEAGNYQVEFVLPDGYEYSPADQGGDDSNDSDAGADGRTDCIELEAGENNDTVDAGISTPKGSIGDTVFNDEDGDGVQDPDEEGVEGVTVNLYECDETTIVATTTTDANGNYNFGDLEAGNYQVEFVLPDGFEYSPADQGGDDANDSDVNADGKTDCIELEAGENNDTVDAGISTVIPFECDENSIITEYQINGVWLSGASELTLNEGDAIVLSMLPNEIGVTITLPDGRTFRDNYEINPLTPADSGVYNITSDQGCVATLKITVIPAVVCTDLVVNAGEDVTIDEGDSTALTVTGGGADVAYLWSNGETTPSITVSPVVNTTYTVTVTGADGCVDYDSVVVIVTPIECDENSVIAEYNVNGEWLSGASELTLNEGEAIILSILPNGLGVTITLPDGSEVSDNYEINPLTPANSGLYTFTSRQGCIATLQLTVIPEDGDDCINFTVNAGEDVTIDKGDSTTLTVTGGGENATYLWSNGETTASITVSPDANTTYSVTVTSADGCVDEDSVNVSVTPDTGVDCTDFVVNAGEDVSIDQADSTTLTVTGGGENATYLWSNGATTASITVSPDADTTYSVTVTSADGCVDEDSVNVSVTPDTGVDCTDFAVNAGEDVMIDQGDSTTLTVTGGGQNATYLWSNGATTASITVSPDADTTYSVTVTNADGCVDEDSVNVSVTPDTGVDCTDFVVNTGEDVTIDQGYSTTLTVTGGGENATYLWSNGATTASITVSPDADTRYSVTVTSADGCVDEDSVSVNVNEGDVCASFVANAGDNLEITLGETVTLSVTGGNSNTTYLWSTGATTQSIMVSPVEDTIYRITITDAINGCESYDYVSVMIVDEQVNCDDFVVDLGADLEVRHGTLVTLTAPKADFYLWSTGETTRSIEINAHIKTAYSVIVRKDKCVGADEIIVEVYCEVDAGPDVTIYQGDSITLTAIGDEGSTYYWSNGETTQSITVSPEDTTTYTVTTNILTCACTATDEVVVYVNDGTNGCEVTATEDTTILFGSSTELTVTEGDEYLWSTGETTQTIQVSPIKETTYSVIVRNGECFDTAQTTVDVTCEADAGEDITIEVGESTTLTATGGGTYRWSTGATTQSLTVSPVETTTYEVTVFVESCACIATDEVTVFVGEDSTDVEDPVSLAKIPSISYYPVPMSSSGTLHIQLTREGANTIADKGNVERAANSKTSKLTENVSVCMFAADGRMVVPFKQYTISQDSNEIEFDVNMLNQGNYYVKVVGESWSQSRTIIVK